MFEKAARQKLRFDYKGWCSVEDLWDIGVTELDELFKTLTKRLQEQQGESLLSTKNSTVEELELKIAIIKHVVEVKLGEAEARKNAKVKAEKKQKILSIIADKQDEELKGKSLEELNKLVDEM